MLELSALFREHNSTMICHLLYVAFQVFQLNFTAADDVINGLPQGYVLGPNFILIFFHQ